jgi:hypothetical protein
MKTHFNRKTRPTPQWEVGDEVWLNGKQVSTTLPSPKLENRWLGPFPITSKISRSAYKLTLPDSMKGVHPVFHVSILQKHMPDTIPGRRRTIPEAVIVGGQEEWEVKEILDRRKKRRKTE